MLSKSEAKDLLTFKYQGIRVEAGIDFEGAWVFRAFLPIGGGEENMNPFLAVDKTTGEVNDFSIAACEDPVELVRLFALAEEKPTSPREALALRKRRR